MESVLRGRVAFMQKVLDVTRQPGMAVGVLHQGNEIFQHHFGVSDIQTGRKVDGDTVFCVASLTKAFVASGLDIVLREHGLSWDSTITSILPDFKHVDAALMHSHLTVRDICSHRTGLLSLDSITQGLDNRILLEKNDAVRICSGLPVAHDIRSKFLYNNAMYELAGCIIERLSEMPTWGDFLRERIFEPAGLTRTTAFADVHQEANVAKPYQVLTDGTLFECATPEMSARTMNGGSGAVRSSLNDLLKWSQIMLASLRNHDTAVLRKHSPIFTRNILLDGETQRTGDYCAGWVYHQTPSKLGSISPNRALFTPTMGEDSASIDVYGHQGDLWGYTCNIYILPNTDSAIVVLSNGTGLSDATDWVAQDLIQVMFDLKPNIDFLNLAEHAAQKYLDAFHEVKRPLMELQTLHTNPPSLQDVVGTYTMAGLDIVNVELTVNQDDKTRLKLTVCGHDDQVWDLWHYHYDTFCCLPDDYDDCLKRGLFSQRARRYLIPFIRNGKNDIDGLIMNMEGGKQVRFSKK